MKLTTWNRGQGHVTVVLFENGTSGAVSTKVFKTKAGAENFGKRIEELCGPNYEKRNLLDLYTTTDPKDGKKTVNFRNENFSSI
jgi:hypothetical protein